MLGQVIAKVDGNTKRLKESYVYGNGERILTRRYKYDDEGTMTLQEEYNFTDIQGSAVMTADAMTGDIISRNKYDPYGNLIWANIQHQSSDISEDRYSYTGKELNSETGLVYFGARWYDGDTGRFVSTDLIAGYLTNPISQNRYQYCFNNPVTYTDPMGLDPIASFDVEVRAKREYNWELFEYIPMAFSEAWTRFWLEEWRNGLILSLSTQYDMKLKILEPNYSYQINIQPTGPDWEYLEKNEFFRADERAIETIERWYKNEPDVFGDFVMLLQRIEEFLPKMRSNNWLGGKGTPGWFRNIYIFTEPVWHKAPYMSARGACGMIVEDLNSWLHIRDLVTEFTVTEIQRSNPFIHHAHLVHLNNEVRDLGIVIDIWQSQSLSLFSVPKWYGGE
ncbi:RHS repeat-associated core domain-containing protein [bacterium]|nr:RHS repeat-associated core domain-containing protein [bacterium]